MSSNRPSIQLGQPIIVENRPGAGATTGANAVAKAEADGYTLLANSSAHTIAPSLFPALNYDVSRDFAAVAPLGVVPSVLLASSAKGFKTASDLVRAAKAKPGSHQFRFCGRRHRDPSECSQVQRQCGESIAVHVPFKAAPEILGEMMAGRIDYFLAPIAVALPFVRDGKLAALAVNTPARVPTIPDVPTLSEAGFVNAEYSFWIAVFVPAKTSRIIVDKLANETRKTLVELKVRDELAALGIEPMELTPAPDAWVKRQIGADADLVSTVGSSAIAGS